MIIRDETGRKVEVEYRVVFWTTKLEIVSAYYDDDGTEVPKEKWPYFIEPLNDILIDQHFTAGVK